MYLCLSCGSSLGIRKNTRNKYCSVQCQQDKQTREKVEAWLAGADAGWTGKTRQLKDFVRKYILKTRGTACSECGWDVRHSDGSILTEIDHTDGDAENCRPENLKILCQNCHALTPTFRARNKKSKRVRNKG